MNFFGEVHEITLCAEQIEDAASEQRGFASSDTETPSPRKHDELMNTLSVRLGKSRIMRASLTRSYIPERSFAYHSALNEDSRISLAEPIAPYNLRERPSLLLPKPEPISTISMLPDKPPSFLQWRGRKVRVVTGIGPERIAPEWWGSSLERSRFSERDYFKVQDDSGRWLWVYRDQGTQEWFLHGIWA
jgi:protein ImuB